MKGRGGQRGLMHAHKMQDLATELKEGMEGDLAAEAGRSSVGPGGGIWFMTLGFIMDPQMFTADAAESLQCG